MLFYKIEAEIINMTEEEIRENQNDREYMKLLQTKLTLFHETNEKECLLFISSMHDRELIMCAVIYDIEYFEKRLPAFLTVIGIKCRDVKMEEFLQRNSGLRSRIAFHVPFTDYSSEELYQILELMAEKQGLSLDNTAGNKLLPIFAEASREPDFGNGRFVRNLLEKARMKQAGRLLKMDVDNVSKEDIADFTLLETAVQTAREEKIRFAVGNVASSNLKPGNRRAAVPGFVFGGRIDKNRRISYFAISYAKLSGVFPVKAALRLSGWLIPTQQRNLLPATRSPSSLTE